MFHITFLLLILSLAVGLAAVTVSLQIYRHYRLGFLRAHLAIIISFNLMIFFNIVALYIFNLPAGSLADGVLKAVGSAYEFLLPLLQLLATYFFLHIIRGLLGMAVAARIRNIAWAVFGGYAALQAIALATSMTFGGTPLSRFVALIVWFFSLAAIYAMLIATFPRIAGIADPARKKALRTYWSLLLGLMTVIILLVLLSHFELLALKRYNLITVFFIIVMNAIPVLYIRWFVEKFHGAAKTGREIASDLTKLFEKYGISPREQEIIRLICGGKTNREIADMLFISLQTVKDHAYRIFRKTGVKNRVQLVNLFIRPDDETGPRS